MSLLSRNKSTNDSTAFNLNAQAKSYDNYKSTIISHIEEHIMYLRGNHDIPVKLHKLSIIDHGSIKIKILYGNQSLKWQDNDTVLEIPLESKLNSDDDILKFRIDILATLLNEFEQDVYKDQIETLMAEFKNRTSGMRKSKADRRQEAR